MLKKRRNRGSLKGPDNSCVTCPFTETLTTAGMTGSMIGASVGTPGMGDASAAAPVASAAMLGGVCCSTAGTLYCPCADLTRNSEEPNKAIPAANSVTYSQLRVSLSGRIITFPDLRVLIQCLEPEVFELSVTSSAGSTDRSIATIGPKVDTRITAPFLGCMAAPLA